MEILIVFTGIVITAFIASGVDSKNHYYIPTPPSVTDSRQIYCEYDDAVVRDKSVRYMRCWKSIELQENVKRIK